MATIVCINGDLGSGKSSAIGKLQDRLHWKVFSTGAAQRQLARDMGITTLELNRISETDRSIDDKIDGVFADLAKSQESLIVDSRMAWHFIPSARKIRLVCHPSTSGRRVFYDADRSAETYATVEAATADIQIRRASEKMRFKTLYDVDVEALGNYDAIIQTDPHPLERVVDKIQSAIESDRSGMILHLSPRLIFPLEPFAQSEGVDIAAEVSTHGPAPIPPDAETIEVIYSNDCFFLIRGVQQLAAAIKADAHWIEARLHAGSTNLDQIKGERGRHVFAQWQNTFGFDFPFWPEVN